jgi:hypothetical protein
MQEKKMMAVITEIKPGVYNGMENHVTSINLKFVGDADNKR